MPHRLHTNRGKTAILSITHSELGAGQVPLPPARHPCIRTALSIHPDLRIKSSTEHTSRLTQMRSKAPCAEKATLSYLYVGTHLWDGGEAGQQIQKREAKLAENSLNPVRKVLSLDGAFFT